jgi:uncharacterized protein (DUF2141 family)
MKACASLFIAASLLVPAARALNLEVLIKNIPSPRGRIAYALFDKKEGFPNRAESAQRSGYASLSGSSEIRLQLQDLPAGSYALAVYQDMNENQKLDKNFLGIPTESIAFSQNPTVAFGPPSFERCRFELSSDLRIEVEMIR